IASGANLDDRGDYRPGLVAAAEHAVRHPLQEAGFTKADVRAVARHWDLPTWDKPAAPCLSSRLAPGLAVTPERTRRVEEAEAFLRSLGLRDCRVRYHEGDLARVEVPVAEVARMAADPVRAAGAAPAARAAGGGGGGARRVGAAPRRGGRGRLPPPPPPGAPPTRAPAGTPAGRRPPAARRDQCLTAAGCPAWRWCPAGTG